MYTPALHLQKPLEDYVEIFDNLSVRSVPLLEALCAPNVVFNDPYLEGGGFTFLQAALVQRFKLYPKANYRVQDFTWARREATAYMYWRFHFHPHRRILVRSQDQVSIDGVTELQFGIGGKIISHCEFWGAHPKFDSKSYKRILS